MRALGEAKTPSIPPNPAKNYPHRDVIMAKPTFLNVLNCWDTGMGLQELSASCKGCINKGSSTRAADLSPSVPLQKGCGIPRVSHQSSSPFLMGTG